jgi:hypothetical protein
MYAFEHPKMQLDSGVDTSSPSDVRFVRSRRIRASDKDLKEALALKIRAEIRHKHAGPRCKAAASIKREFSATVVVGKTCGLECLVGGSDAVTP